MCVCVQVEKPVGRGKVDQLVSKPGWVTGIFEASLQTYLQECLQLDAVTNKLRNTEGKANGLSTDDQSPRALAASSNSLSSPVSCLVPLGLAELAARKYKQAAKCFLLASFDHCDFPEVRRSTWDSSAFQVHKRK